MQDKQEIEEEIIRRYMCCVDEEQESTEQGTASRSGGMLQSQMNETVAKVRQALRTETGKTIKYMIIYKAFYNILRLRKGMIPLE